MPDDSVITRIAFDGGALQDGTMDVRQLAPVENAVRVLKKIPKSEQRPGPRHACAWGRDYAPVAIPIYNTWRWQHHGAVRVSKGRRSSAMNQLVSIVANLLQWIPLLQLSTRG